MSPSLGSPASSTGQQMSESQQPGCYSDIDIKLDIAGKCQPLPTLSCNCPWEGAGGSGADDRSRTCLYCHVHTAQEVERVHGPEKW